MSNFDYARRLNLLGYDAVGHIVNFTYDREPIRRAYQPIAVKPQTYLSINMTYDPKGGELRKEKRAEEPES